MKVKKYLIKTKKGVGHFLYPMFLLIFLMIMFCYIYYSTLIEYTRNTVDDGLMAATLASACINIKDDKDFDEASILVITDCYSIFEVSLKENLNLDSMFKPIPGTACDLIISSPITIDEYIFYREENGKIYKTTKGGVVNEYVGLAGKVKTNNGIVIVTNSVYSKISFDIYDSVNDEHKNVSRECVVDVFFE